MDVRFRRLSVIIGFLLVLFHGSANAQISLSEARELFKQEKYAQALSLTEKILSAQPGFDSALVLKAECLWRLKKYQDGFSVISKVIDQSPKNYYAWYVRSRMHRNGGDMMEAKNDLTMALRNVGADTLAKELYNDRSWANLRMRNLAAALDDARQVLEIDSMNTRAMNFMALALNQQDFTDSAVQVLQKAYAIDTLDIGTRINMGFVLLKKEKFDDAIYWLNKALQLDPDEAYTYNNRGYAKYKLGNLTEAMADINKSIGMDGRNSYAFRNRALVYIALAKYDKACDDLSKATLLGYRESYGDEVDELKKEYCKQ